VGVKEEKQRSKNKIKKFTPSFRAHALCLYIEKQKRSAKEKNSA